MKALRVWLGVAVGALLIVGGCISTVKNPGRDTARAEKDRHDLADVAIAQWSNDRTLLDEVVKPKDEALGDCLCDKYNEELARAFLGAPE